MESSARTKKETTGIWKSGDLARKETLRGAKQSRKAGSTSPFGWLRTKRQAPRRGTCSAPTTSMRRKKTRSAKRSTNVMARLNKLFEKTLREKREARRESRETRAGLILQHAHAPHAPRARRLERPT